MEFTTHAALKRLPSVDTLLQYPAVSRLVLEYGHDAVRDAARAELARWRSAIRDASHMPESLEPAQLCGQIAEALDRALQRAHASSMVPVVNLTGTVIHTNLGRAILPRVATDAMVNAASGPVTLEYDLARGGRGERDDHVEQLICQLTGAEAATVVNNNAAAVLLLLNTLARDREVVISRGELVEIGGSFRIPDVMQAAGCTLREVGTTNRTHEQDYVRAISAATALLMHVHTSNYAIHGFTSAVSIATLAGIAHDHSLPMVSDLGSGTLLDLQQYGLPRELTARDVLTQGADLVCFSGDKLLGGPQAGIIAGRRDLIDQVRRNPLRRALRLDKLILAALLEVLRLYLDPRRLPERLPTLKYLTRSATEIRSLGERMLPGVRRQLAAVAEVTLEPCHSQIGSGAMPEDLLPSWGFFLRPHAGAGSTEDRLQALMRHLRELPLPVLGRLQDGQLVLDLRCLDSESLDLGQAAEETELPTP